MHRHSSLASQVQRKRARTTGFCYRVLRLFIYVGVTAAALCSMLLIPAHLSTFRSRIVHSDPVDTDKQDVVVKRDNIPQNQQIPSHVLTTAPQSRSREPLLKFEKYGTESRTGQIPKLWTITNDETFLRRILPVIQQPRSRKPLLDYKMLWKPPPNRGFEPCVSRGRSYKRLEMTRGYLVVHANGGLNQMRAGICDMVAVARLINATLVIPELDKRSFWQDSSTFSDVFDEEYFIKALENDVPVVKSLPEDLISAPKARKQFTSWSSAKYYQEEIVQLWDNYMVIHAAKSDSRLANNNLPHSIQKLRCRVHYEALRFAPAIEALGKTLVERMRSNGPFIALHLRYEKDMLAFSGCTYGLSDTEIEELTLIRESTPHWKVKVINSTEQRLQGLCPLTPKEVGIFLQALGYPSTTRIYIAAGEIYGNNSMEQLRARFPNLMSKETVATRKELRPFRRHATQLAALDYIVSVESDVFVPTCSGNMARAVEGHRRFLGHRKTISPDRKQLVELFDQLDEGTLQEGNEFSSTVIEMHAKRQGAPRKRRGPVAGTKGRDRFRTEEAFYTNPLPDCLCQKHSSILNLKKSQKVHQNVSLNNAIQMMKS